MLAVHLFTYNLSSFHSVILTCMFVKQSKREKYLRPCFLRLADLQLARALAARVYLLLGLPL